jgi:hypothetical protein
VNASIEFRRVGAAFHLSVQPCKGKGTHQKKFSQDRQMKDCSRSIQTVHAEQRLSRTEATTEPNKAEG